MGHVLPHVIISKSTAMDRLQQLVINEKCFNNTFKLDMTRWNTELCFHRTDSDHETHETNVSAADMSTRVSATQEFFE